MREIDEALDGELDYLFVATSTTGTLRGCGDYVREHGRATRIVAVDSAGSALFGGRRGRRVVPGFGAGVETNLSAGADFDELLRVSDLDCVVGCRRLVEREAILAGGSSGGVAFALEAAAERMQPGSRCAVIFPDGGSGYLETVYDDAWVERELGCGPRSSRSASGRASSIAVDLLLEKRPEGAQSERALRVAIAGCGPKGLYALERLLGHAAELPATELRMEVDIFEPHPAAGAGANYDPAQPEYLRMNFAADQLDMWWPGGGVVPAAERLSFEAWRAKRGGGVDEYPPRAQVGRYLSEGLAAVLRHAPANVDVQMHRAAVDELAPPAASGWWSPRDPPEPTTRC